MKCPVCGEGTITKHVEEHIYTVGHTLMSAPLHYTRCDTCTSDFADEEQSKLNKLETENAERSY